MLRTLHYEPCLGRLCHPAHSASRSPQPPWSVRTALLGIFGGFLAISEGLAAYRHFEDLRSHGVPHHAALRRALGICATSHLIN
jgi:hypothetical protein